MNDTPQWGDVTPLIELHLGNSLWRFPRPVLYAERPQGRFSNEQLVVALLRDERRALVRSQGVVCVCPACLGVKTQDNGLACGECLGTGEVMALPIENRVEELPL